MSHYPEGRFRLGAALILLGCLPFAGGAFVGAIDKLPGICPFRFATGLPCPLCGGTRAFAFAANGDMRFLSFNAFWVFVALAIALTGVLVMAGYMNVRGFWSRGRVPVYMLIGMLAGGWAWALANRVTIIS